MKFEFEFSEHTMVRLIKFKNGFDADIYHSIDYDLKNTYKPSTWDDIINHLLDKNEHFWDLINDKDKKLKVVIRDGQ